jgi:hypothetical protein
MFAQINARNLFPFWAKRADVEHDEIKQLMEGMKAVPFHWSYKRDLEPLIQQSARFIKHADSDRSSLILRHQWIQPSRCAADDREALEQLCRTITPPALANDRVQCNAAGQVVRKRKIAWRPGHPGSAASEWLRDRWKRPEGQG